MSENVSQASDDLRLLIDETAGHLQACESVDATTQTSSLSAIVDFDSNGRLFVEGQRDRHPTTTTTTTTRQPTPRAASSTLNVITIEQGDSMINQTDGDACLLCLWDIGAALFCMGFFIVGFMLFFILVGYFTEFLIWCLSFVFSKQSFGHYALM